VAHPPPYPPPQGGRGNSLAGIDRPSPLEGEGQGGGSLLDVPEQGGRENQFRRVPEPGLVDAEDLGTLAAGLRAAMDALYYVCVLVAGGALVLISAVIPYGVFTRYVLNSAASWPEPMAVLLAIVLTFIGAAACYRARLHMRVTVVVGLLPALGQRIVNLLADGVMAAVCLFMMVWGERLVATTWHQSIAEFPFLSVGVTYLPIPVGGAITLLFVIERVLIGPPAGDAQALH
jgi:TRAP-type C4-dicarboxylate transport system permease small subunit